MIGRLRAHRVIANCLTLPGKSLQTVEIEIQLDSLVKNMKILGEESYTYSLEGIKCSLRQKQPGVADPQLQQNSSGKQSICKPFTSFIETSSVSVSNTRSKHLFTHPPKRYTLIRLSAYTLIRLSANTHLLAYE